MTRDPVAALSEFVSRSRLDAIPRVVRERARLVLVDTLGGALAGALDPAARLVQRYIRGASGSGARCTVLGADFRASAEHAALANGVAAHVLDLDDTSRSMSGHASVSVLPVCLALAEDPGRSGGEALAAFVLGFEVQAKLARLVGPPLRASGWHTAGTLGTLGATAAAANLLRLDPAATRHALGIASSLAAGLTVNHGSMAKSLNPGNAARNGILAASLAASGFRSQPDAVRGFLSAFGGRARLDEEALRACIARLGEPFDLVEPGTDIKLYPSCNYTHTTIDAVLEILAEERRPAASVAGVDCRIDRLGRYLLRRPPETGYEAKFSLEFVIACALAHGRVEVDHFADETVSALRPLMARVRVIETEPGAGEPAGPVTVAVAYDDGTVATRSLCTPRGSVESPLTDRELEAKYLALASRAVSPALAASSLGLLRGLEHLARIEEVTAVLRSPDSDRDGCPDATTPTERGVERTARAGG